MNAASGNFYFLYEPNVVIQGFTVAGTRQVSLQVSFTSYMNPVLCYTGVYCGWDAASLASGNFY